MSNGRPSARTDQPTASNVPAGPEGPSSVVWHMAEMAVTPWRSSRSDHALQAGLQVVEGQVVHEREQRGHSGLAHETGGTPGAVALDHPTDRLGAGGVEPLAARRAASGADRGGRRVRTSTTRRPPEAASSSAAVGRRCSARAVSSSWKPTTVRSGDPARSGRRPGRGPRRRRCTRRAAARLLEHAHDHRVHVRIDEPRRQRTPGEIDDLVVVGERRGAVGDADRHDAVVDGRDRIDARQRGCGKQQAASVVQPRRGHRGHACTVVGAATRWSSRAWRSTWMPHPGPPGSTRSPASTR